MQPSSSFENINTQAGTAPPAYEKPLPPPAQGQPVNKYETALNIRCDVEAALCYILGCVTGIIFLILETKNDYVRFNAWQSILFFGPCLFLHIVFIFVPYILGLLLFLFQLAVAILLILKAYQNGQTLVRFELPLIGPIASKWTDNE